MDVEHSVAVTDDLHTVCREIAAEGKTDEEWAAIEADDWFQRGPFVGGYGATEGAFTFSYHAPDGSELWFQFTLPEVDRILSGALTRLPARPAG